MEETAAGYVECASPGCAPTGVSVTDCRLRVYRNLRISRWVYLVWLKSLADQGFVGSCSQSELLASRPLLYRQQKKAGEKGDPVLWGYGYCDPASNALTLVEMAFTVGQH